MNTLINRIALLLIAATLLIACNDKNKAPQPDLTNCDGCDFLHISNADLTVPGYYPGPGNYRIFWSNLKKGPLTQNVYMKAPMTAKTFELNKSDIMAGRVLVRDNCPSCNMIEMLPVDGKISGVNTTPNVAPDRAKWLIEAKIIRHPAKEFINLKDTIYIKQYFVPGVNGWMPL